MTRNLQLAIFILVGAANVNQTFGQERTNREKLRFESISGSLTKATGWAYNSVLGEWVDFQNVISDEKDFKTNFKSLQGSYMMSKTTQNFIKIQTKTVTLREHIYYVLIVKKWSGAYKYPAIREDWYTYKEIIGYIFTKNEYQKLLNINSIIELKTKVAADLSLIYKKYDETKFLELIQSEIETEKSTYSFNYTFPVMKSNEGKIRFYVPDLFSEYSSYDFNKKYFETDFEQFSKILLN